MVVFSLVTFTWRAWPSMIQSGLLQLQAHVGGDDSAAGEDGDILQHLLAAVAEAGGLDAHHVQGAAQAVDDQGGQGVALHILSDDQQLLAGLDHLLQNGQQLLDVGDLLVGDEDVGRRPGRPPSSRCR